MINWTLCWFPSGDEAERVGLTLPGLWEILIQAYYLDKTDPVAEWRKTFEKIAQIKARLNALQVKSYHWLGENADLWLTPAMQAQWLGGDPRNLPSFEVFATPDFRQTRGWVRYNTTITTDYNGTYAKNVLAVFDDSGKATIKAEEGGELIQEFINKMPDFAFLGEMAIVDHRLGNITHPTGNGMLDENLDCHGAFGTSFKESYSDDPAVRTAVKNWAELGYNNPDCPVHWDMVLTGPLTITAHLMDGSEMVIYKDGQFVDAIWEG